jgi:phosphatidylserine/phosphatidylglycerophosphate/cardiolipin synthase-like enzyme
MTNETIIGKQFANKVIPLIEGAKLSIKIVVFDWRWYANDPGNIVQVFNQTIARAVKRGVKTQAIINSDAILTPLKEIGVDAVKLQTAGIMHTKLMIIDDKIVVIGSHNYTHNAFVVNHELSVILSDIENIDNFTNYFNSLWQ